MVDINYHHPDGRTLRVREVSPVQDKRGALAHEREILRALQAGTYGKERTEPTPRRSAAQPQHTQHQRAEAATPRAHEAPTIAAFVEDFITGHSLVERLRDSTIDSQRGLLRNHIVPTVGSVRVDEIHSKHFGQLKRSMSEKDPPLSGKTINNALTVLSRMVRFWYEREGQTAPRIKAGLIKLDEQEAEFWEPAEYEALVSAAATIGPDVHALVLLMGDAGLRQGEVCALHWVDIRHEPEPLLRLKRSRYKGRESGTKSRKPRTVPMTPRLVAALEALPRQRRQEHVLFDGLGQPLTPKAIQGRIEKAEAAAGLEGTGLSHKIRHTFATRLVANGVPLWVIKELLGHADLRTTQRYLHMITGAATQAIASLDGNHGTGHGTVMAPPPATT
jgi:integrase